MPRFEKELPDWEAEGTKPPETTRKNGWQAKQKPPANWFNWFFNKAYQALKELQEKAALHSDLTAHKDDKTNPHAVTKAQVGLGNLDNTKQATKAEFDAHTNNKENPHAVTKSQVGLGNVDDAKQATKTEFDAHTANKTNPHQVTKAQVSLGSVQNYPVSTQAQAETGASNAAYMTPLTTKQAIDTIGRTLADNAEAAAKSASLSKNGDTALGPLNLASAEALNVQYGYLKHYVGKQTAGTVIRIYFAKKYGEWAEYLDVTVGAEAVESTDAKFSLDKITSNDTYVTGRAPADYTGSKSVINGVERGATNTIVPQNVIEFKRDKTTGIAKINGQDVLTKNMGVQEYALTDVTGRRKYLGSPITQDIRTLSVGYYYGVSGSNRESMTALGIPEGAAINGIFQLDVTEDGGGRKQLRFYESYGNKEWFQHIHTNGDSRGWEQIANVNQLKELTSLELSGFRSIVSNWDLTNLDAHVSKTLSVYITTTKNPPEGGAGWLNVNFRDNGYATATWQAWSSNRIWTCFRDGSKSEWSAWNNDLKNTTYTKAEIESMINDQSNLLWEGAVFPIEVTYTFKNNQKISEQKSGIVLVWSDYYYDTGTANNYNSDFTYIPKWYVSQASRLGTNIMIPVATGLSANNQYIAVKEMQLTDTTLRGTSNNASTVGRDAVLRAIVGV
ncbi:pyocin knob domain-containing protein [Listeria ilorinensis]|uniref:pyocin knob domain-containing protein n=1 Tax=Listeria ilorinensis TaxID=2867439 RepID=UPI001EF69F60|nr:pyocin knob domain-containing protein [Listeria ilorinensis]